MSISILTQLYNKNNNVAAAAACLGSAKEIMRKATVSINSDLEKISKILCFENLPEDDPVGLKLPENAAFDKNNASNPKILVMSHCQRDSACKSLALLSIKVSKKPSLGKEFDADITIGGDPTNHKEIEGIAIEDAISRFNDLLTDYIDGRLTHAQKVTLFAKMDPPDITKDVKLQNAPKAKKAKGISGEWGASHHRDNNGETLPEDVTNDLQRVKQEDKGFKPPGP